MPQEINKMSVKEFREKGYLQELNRRFLHPIGLALEVVVGDGTESFGGVWDYRGDPEGIVFGKGFSKDPDSCKRAKYVKGQREAKFKVRESALGFIIQPIEGLS